jgi:hypothetical protein
MKADAPAVIATALGRADAERARAQRAVLVAERHERLYPEQGRLGALHARMADLQRHIALRHLAAAEVHEAFAARLELWTAFAEGEKPHLFMTAVADTSKSDGAALTVHDANRVEVLVATSGPTVQTAQDWEFTFGEGPSHDAVTTRRPVFAAGSVIQSRWPNYGAVAAELGLHVVAAVPLEIPSEPCIGSLTVFDPWLGERSAVIPVLRTVADAVMQSFLLASDPAHTLPLFEEADFRLAVFQAAGMIMIARDCDMQDALALLRARTFVIGRPLKEVATGLVDGSVRLNDLA